MSQDNEFNKELERRIKLCKKKYPSVRHASWNGIFETIRDIKRLIK